MGLNLYLEACLQSTDVQIVRAWWQRSHCIDVQDPVSILQRPKQCSIAPYGDQMTGNRWSNASAAELRECGGILIKQFLNRETRVDIFSCFKPVWSIRLSH